MATQRKKINMSLKQTLIVILKFALFSNIILSIAWFRDHSIDIKRIKYQDEFVKQKVAIDSLYYYTIGDTSSSTDYIVICYNNFKDEIELIKGDSRYITYNDSIYVWHHPIYKDLIGQKEQASIKESFFIYKIFSGTFLWYLGLGYLVYLLMTDLFIPKLKKDKRVLFVVIPLCIGVLYYLIKDISVLISLYI